MWGQGHLSHKTLTLDRRHVGHDLEERKKYTLHISKATAFAFEAEILLSEQSQQLRLGPDKEALQSFFHSEQGGA